MPDDPAVGAPDEPTDDDRPERGRWARLNEALGAATKPLREDFEWLIGEYERLRGSESALRRAFDVAQQAGVDLWAEVERLRAAAEALATEAHETEQVLAAALPDEFPTLPDSDIRCTGEHVLPTLAAHVIRALRAAAPASEDDPARIIADALDDWATLTDTEMAEHLDEGDVSDFIAERLRAGSPPPTPAPTRERLAEVLDLTFRDHPPDTTGVFFAQADAVMGLIAQPDREPVPAPCACRGCRTEGGQR